MVKKKLKHRKENIVKITRSFLRDFLFFFFRIAYMNYSLKLYEIIHTFCAI